MKNIIDLKDAVSSSSSDGVFRELYGETTLCRQRYSQLIDAFAAQFPEKTEVSIFSTPGRTEVGGNHTDHNGGHVLAGAVDLDVVSVAAKQDGAVVIHSEGYPPFTIFLDDLTIHPDEAGTSAALVRGVCAKFRQLGYQTGGFCAVMNSTVLKGSGLSSSAAFEVQIANILNHLYNAGRIAPESAAKVAQYAENIYFGKPCGLMDMSSCAVGGLVMIDFKDFENPVFDKVAYDFSSSGYTLILVDTGGSHADMTDDYVALEHEMKEVARVLGKTVLRECTKAQVMDSLGYLRARVSDRAILRAIHFYDDDERVVQQTAALRNNKMDYFLQLILDSGRSSWELCQNCYSNKFPDSQGIPIALEITRNFLGRHGAYRIHGGGFAGMIQVFVPNGLKESYIHKMAAVFGNDAIFESKIRRQGAIEVSF